MEVECSWLGSGAPRDPRSNPRGESVCKMKSWLPRCVWGLWCRWRSKEDASPKGGTKAGWERPKGWTIVVRKWNGPKVSQTLSKICLQWPKAVKRRNTNTIQSKHNKTMSKAAKGIKSSHKQPNCQNSAKWVKAPKLSESGWKCVALSWFAPIFILARPHAICRPGPTRANKTSKNGKWRQALVVTLVVMIKLMVVVVMAIPIYILFTKMDKYKYVLWVRASAMYNTCI